VKKKAQIFLVVVGRALQTMPSFNSKQTMPAPSSTDVRNITYALKVVTVAELFTKIPEQVKKYNRLSKQQRHWHLSLYKLDKRVTLNKYIRLSE